MNNLKEAAGEEPKSVVMNDQGLSLGKGLHIAHLNVRSLLSRNKGDMLRWQIENSDIDIFTISETWLNVGIPDETIKMNKYKSVRLDRSWPEGQEGNQAKKRGGVLCYIKDWIKYSDTKYAHLTSPAQIYKCSG